MQLLPGSRLCLPACTVYDIVIAPLDSAVQAHKSTHQDMHNGGGRCIS